MAKQMTTTQAGTSIYRLLIFLLAAVFLLSTLPASVAAKQEKKKAKVYLDYAKGAANWLEQLAEPVDKDNPKKGIQWQYCNDLNIPVSLNNMYGGGSGVVLFYLNLYRVTGDKKYKKICISGADGLLARATVEDDKFFWEETDTGRNDRIYSYVKEGYYTGAAGIGWVLLQVYNEFGGKKYLKGAVGAADWLMDTATVEKDKAKWVDVYKRSTTDIIAGNAGIILFFLDLYDSRKNKTHLKFAEKLGNWLIDVATKDEYGYKWPAHISKTVGRIYPNFSHGVSGIAYALACLYEKTGKEIYLKYAQGSADWLIAKAEKTPTGVAWRHFEDPDKPEEGKSHRTGWCHGPAGTCNFFVKMAAISSDKKKSLEFKNYADMASSWEFDAVNPAPGKTAYWNPGLCCGAASIGDYLLNDYLMGGDKDSLDAAVAVAGHLCKIADEYEKGCYRWCNSKRPNQEGHIYYAGNLLTGSSGVALFFLKLYVVLGGADKKIIELPDRRLAAPAANSD
ncbi:lanthionine synthetase LanC family protein [Planctomycetota bacterium]